MLSANRGLQLKIYCLKSALLLLLPLLSISLRLLSARRFPYKFLMKVPDYPDAKLSLHEELQDRIVEAVLWSKKHSLIPITCLPFAITLCLSLRCFGLPAALRIGVQRVDTVFQAHAWVDCLDRSFGAMVSEGDNFQALSSVEVKAMQFHTSKTCKLPADPHRDTIEAQRG